MVIVALIVLLGRSQTQNSSNLNLLATVTDRQMAMNQTLTNLLLSKDPMTFQQLQATTSNLQSPQFDEPVSPLDDASIAHALAERYKQHGLNPNSAYAQEDVDMVSEFGFENP
jgi:hypothetical protein